MQPHHFTVDVEEYFQVAAFEGVVPRSRWHDHASRVRAPMREILDLLMVNAARGTFFFLGWVADRWPELVRHVVREGHEVASHGWDHARVTTLAPQEFRASIRRTKDRLEEIGGVAVKGFRAPSFSITPRCSWALDVLVEEGHTYDSSICPAMRLDGNGHPNGQRDPHWLRVPSGRIAEFPPAVSARLGVALPAGGAYFRALPYSLTHGALRDCEQRGAPGTFYVHPWELDPEQPRIRAPWLSRLRHYTGLARTRPRLARLLGDFSFGRICDSRMLA